jgi:hypothetical protein
MEAKQLRIRSLVLFLVPLLMISAGQARAEETLVRGVPYIAQKAHID